jgi:membrane protein DedA with SNARE-associated domain
MDKGFLIGYLNQLPDYLIYLSLGISAFLENIFPPLPGDTIVLFGSFLVGIGRLSFLGAYLSTTAGSLIGFISIYFLGRYLGRRFFIERDYRFLKASDIIKAEDWFRRYGYTIILINRFIPGIRSVIALAGGISGLDSMKVAVLALISGGLWNFIWTILGFSLGSNWDTFQASVAKILWRYNIMLLIFLGVLILLLIARWYLKKKKIDKMSGL